MESVLIIYNAVDAVTSGGAGKAWSESNAGILDELRSVENALARLGATYLVESVQRIEQLPEILHRNRQPIVFNLVEELPGKISDACYVPAVCQAHGRVCTGNGTAAMILSQDKWLTKAILKSANLPCPDGIVIAVGQNIKMNSLAPGRYIVKPAFSDASEGIDTNSIVDVPGDAAEKAVRRIHQQMKQPAVVEQFIPDRELNVAAAAKRR